MNYCVENTYSIELDYHHSVSFPYITLCAKHESNNTIISYKYGQNNTICVVRLFQLEIVPANRLTYYRSVM